MIDTEDGGDQDRRNLNEVVLRALRFVAEDCLGGYGSRGSGKVSFADLTVDGKSVPLPEA